METREHLEQQIVRMTRELARMSHEKPWADEMLYLMQIAGCGVVTGMSILAGIGDICRFENPKALASYAGLVPGLEQSVVKLRGKGITKEGRWELRCLSWTDSPGGAGVNGLAGSEGRSAL